MHYWNGLFFFLHCASPLSGWGLLVWNRLLPDACVCGHAYLVALLCKPNHR